MRTNVTYAESDLMGGVSNADGSDVIIPVRSKSNPNRFYNVDLTHGRCSCPAWTHRRGPRVPCKHLLDLGYTSLFQEDVESLKQPLNKNKEKLYAYNQKDD